MKAMIYRGRPDRVHIHDGFRADVGKDVARFIGETMRADAIQDGLETATSQADKALCPGCYMTVLVNAARELARANNQTLSELGRTLAYEFHRFEHGDPGPKEEVEVQVDPEPAQPSPADVPYMDDFGPNPLAPERDYGLNAMGFVPGLASYGLDIGLLR